MQTTYSVLCGDCSTLIPTLPDRSIRLVYTSPPYALQRKSIYPGIPAKEYPAWMAGILSLLAPKLTMDASVFLNIRDHQEKGALSGYVLDTVLACRQVIPHIDTLIWFCPYKPPLGSNLRPRRAYEPIYWFSPSRKPFINLRASTAEKTWKPGRKRQPKAWLQDMKLAPRQMRHDKPPRITDVVTAVTGSIDAGIDHAAMQPRAVPRYIIQHWSEPGDVVFDPCCGSGTTLLAAQELGWSGIGIDAVPQYVELCRQRLAAAAAEKAASPHPSRKLLLIRPNAGRIVAKMPK
ncbi:MAG: DNA-methyltransferase [Bacillota bacterium]